MTSVFQWPRRTLVERIGFPDRDYEVFLPPVSSYSGFPEPKDRSAPAFAVQSILQRLCHASSNPYGAVIVAAAHWIGASFAARVDSDSTHVRAPAMCRSKLLAAVRTPRSPPVPRVAGRRTASRSNMPTLRNATCGVHTDAQCVARVRQGKSRPTVPFHICRKTN